jgi:hypothetical protein
MPLDTWVMQPGWNFLQEYTADELLDKMEEAGVANLAFGAALPLESNPANYRGALGPSPPFDFGGQEQAIKDFLDAAWIRNLRVYAYGTNPHMTLSEEITSNFRLRRRLGPDGEVDDTEFTWGTCANDLEYREFYLGRIRDAHQSFPRLAGILNDGPEFGYEVSEELFDGMLTIFGCFGSCCERKSAALGYDFDSLKQAALSLMRFLRSLDAIAIERTLEHRGDPVEALAAAAGEPAIVDWYRFKRDSVADYVQELYQGIKETDPDLELGIGSRLPAFTPFTASDLERLAHHADFVLPKLYLWMGGFDGLYGTVYRWVETLSRWNPGLSEGQLLTFVHHLFDLRLPGVEGLDDLRRHVEHGFADKIEGTPHGDPFPAEFFTEVVADQVRKMIDQVGDAARVRPWLDCHHGGRTLTPDELDQVLAAGEGAGLQTYLNYCRIDPGNWAVARKHARRR